jgi:hypothetical protein
MSSVCTISRPSISNTNLRSGGGTPVRANASDPVEAHRARSLKRLRQVLGLDDRTLRIIDRLSRARGTFPWLLCRGWCEAGVREDGRTAPRVFAGPRSERPHR